MEGTGKSQPVPRALGWEGSEGIRIRIQLPDPGKCRLQVQGLPDVGNVEGLVVLWWVTNPGDPLVVAVGQQEDRKLPFSTALSDEEKSAPRWAGLS